MGYSLAETMGKPLSVYAIKSARGPTGGLETLAVPLLVWSAPPGETNNELVLVTHAAGVAGIPRHGEPIIFELIKVAGKANPFAMGVTVGRNENNDIVLDHASISRFHAYFQKDLRTQKWKLVDAESKNGTWIGPLKLEPNVGQVLEDKASLRFGDLELVFMLPDTFRAFLKMQMGD